MHRYDRFARFFDILIRLSTKVKTTSRCGSVTPKKQNKRIAQNCHSERQRLKTKTKTQGEESPTSNRLQVKASCKGQPLTAFGGAPLAQGSLGTLGKV